MSTDSTPLSSFPAPVNALIQGASRGLGLEFTRQLLAAPNVSRVFASCRTPSTAAALQSLVDQHPRRLQLLPMDVTVEATVESAAGAVGAHTDNLGLLINCAGLLHEESGMRPERKLADIDPDHMLRSFQVNALGPALVAKHFAHLLPRKDKAVVASLSARVGSIGDNRLGGWYAYRASKAAQNMITRNLSIELRRRSAGAICVALHPGTVDTDLSRPFQRNVPAERLFDRARAVAQLLAVIDGLQPEDNGRFYAWDGQEIVW